MKKLLIAIIIILLVIVGLLLNRKETLAPMKTETIDSSIQTGTYSNENGKILGQCTIKTENQWHVI